MSYMVYGYGSYDVDQPDVSDIETLEEAIEIFMEHINEWCEEHGMDIEDTDYTEGDDYFEYGEEEEGVCIFTIYEVPEINNEADQALWDARMEMDNASYAAEDYKFSLMDCGVSEHTAKAKDLIDRAMELMGGWKWTGKN